MSYNRAYFVKWRTNLKLEAINAFGGICKCCDEDRIEFLTLSHPHNDGLKHRKQLGKGWNAGGWCFYSKLKKAKFKTKFVIEVLCQNCNTSWEHYGYCPHKKQTPTVEGEEGPQAEQVSPLTNQCLQKNLKHEN